MFEAVTVNFVKILRVPTSQSHHNRKWSDFASFGFNIKRELSLSNGRINKNFNGVCHVTREISTFLLIILRRYSRRMLQNMLITLSTFCDFITRYYTFHMLIYPIAMKSVQICHLQRYAVLLYSWEITSQMLRARKWCKTSKWRKESNVYSPIRNLHGKRWRTNPRHGVRQTVIDKRLQVCWLLLLALV